MNLVAIKLEEAGYEEALLGLSLAFKKDPAGMEAVARKLFCRDGGHNKFLESMVVWLDIKAPRMWWQQFDTYRIGVTKQSESTMHTMCDRELTEDDFVGSIPKSFLQILNLAIRQRDWLKVKRLLPESFIQRRIVCLNYKALRGMILQRRNHRLGEWREFINQVVKQVDHPGLLPPVVDVEGV